MEEPIILKKSHSSCQIGRSFGLNATLYITLNGNFYPLTRISAEDGRGLREKDKMLNPDEPTQSIPFCWWQEPESTDAEIWPAARQEYTVTIRIKDDGCDPADHH